MRGRQCRTQRVAPSGRVTFDKCRHLRRLGAIGPLDECNAEVDAPNLHARVNVIGPNVIDPIDERADFNFDMEPRPALDRASGLCVGDVVDVLQHDSY